MSSSLPITAPRRIRRDSHFSFPRIDKGSRTKDFLTERARATNLFVLLLVGISIMSLLGNINSYFVRDVSCGMRFISRRRRRGWNGQKLMGGTMRVYF